MKFYKLIIASTVLTLTLIGCSAGQSTGSDSSDVDKQSNEEVPEESAGGEVSSTISLANSYETLEELTKASAVIAEVNINDIQSVDEEKDSTFYNATVTDLLKGSLEDKEVIITQLGTKNETEKAEDVKVNRENPFMETGDSYVLFLKKGEDDQVGEVFYVSGEYQGKYRIQDEQVFSVNEEANTKATVKGEELQQFKEEITKLVQTAQ